MRTVSSSSAILPRKRLPLTDVLALVVLAGLLPPPVWATTKAKSLVILLTLNVSNAFEAPVGNWIKSLTWSSVVNLVFVPLIVVPLPVVVISPDNVIFWSNTTLEV